MKPHVKRMFGRKWPLTALRKAVKGTYEVSTTHIVSLTDSDSH